MAPNVPLRPFCAAILLFFLLSTLGCVTDQSQISQPASTSATVAAASPSHGDAMAVPEEPPRLAALSPAPPWNNTSGSTGSSQPSADAPPPPDAKADGKSDQALLDLTLSYIDAANDYWEQGDLDNAIEALDQGYALILRVSAEADANIQQQREDLRVTISKRIIEVYTSRFTVANGDHKEIPLVTNRHVERALALFQTQQRSFFLSAYKRSGRYRPAIVAALKEAGLPEELSWLPLIESGYKVKALSRARALGLWQFIASTGYKYGLNRTQWVDERMDPEKSTQAAIAYLTELHQIFGDWTTVLAGYNCGENLVLRRIRTQQINYLDNFWDLYAQLPTETAFYVPQFLAVLHIVQNPAAYGFELPPVDEPGETETVTIEKQVHLKDLARAMDVSQDALAEMNPELRQGTTPNTPYELRVPVGKGPVIVAKICELPVYCPPAPVSTYARYKVRKGDTLSSIARRHRTSVKALMAANNLKKSNAIKIGWTLKIPGKGAPQLAQASPAGKSSPPPARPATVTYKVRKGDSLWTIAQQYATTTQAIKTYNNLRTSRLQIGQALVIPAALGAAPAGEIRKYVVSRGDSPYSIALQHRMSISELLKLNNLSPRSTIYPGQVLIVRAG